MIQTYKMAFRELGRNRRRAFFSSLAHFAAELEAAAKKEGGLTWYTAQTDAETAETARVTASPRISTETSSSPR